MSERKEMYFIRLSTRSGSCMYLSSFYVSRYTFKGAVSWVSVPCDAMRLPFDFAKAVLAQLGSVSSREYHIVPASCLSDSIDPEA